MFCKGLSDEDWRSVCDCFEAENVLGEEQLPPTPHIKRPVFDLTLPPPPTPGYESYRPFWRHERFGSYTLARVLCFFFGHDVNRWQDEDGEWWRGDCHRCWA